jgi:hypothetical protein
MRRYAIPALLAALAFGSAPAIACDSLGENMHMGNIVSIDRSSNTFVILDAESQKQIRFNASKEVLKPVAVNDMVEVGYEVIGDGELRATSLSRI